jgi:hypothetical protein
LLLANFIISQLLLTFYTYRRLTTDIFSHLVILAVAVDLILAGGSTINPLQPDTWWHDLSGGAHYILEQHDEGRVFPLGMGSEAATVSYFGQYFPSVYQIRSAGGHGSSLRSARYEKFMDEAHPVAAIQLLGVRYLLTQGKLGADAAATYPLVYQDNNSYVYRNDHPLPRAFIVHQVITAATTEEALSYFQTNNLAPRQTVVLEGSPPTLPKSETPPVSHVNITQENPQTVNLQVTTNAAGYLVLLDSFYPGWVATIDQQPTPIYRANYLGRAIFMPKGEHVVQFHYRPMSFWGGMVLATVTLLVMGMVTFINKTGYR